MDNQHTLIRGYRDLSLAEIDMMNHLKAKEEDLKAALDFIEIESSSDTAAARWLAIARTHLETGIMFALKAIARPEGGLGRK